LVEKLSIKIRQVSFSLSKSVFAAMLHFVRRKSDLFEPPFHLRKISKTKSSPFAIFLEDLTKIVSTILEIRRRKKRKLKK